MQPLLRQPLGRCRLGVGRVDITPPADAYHRNWGAALHDRAEGVHRPLLATVLVLADEADGPPAALFTLDLGWLRHREMDDLLQALRAGAGLPAQDLVVTFSHTHAAINLDLERAGEVGGERIAPYLESLPARLLEAYVAARDSLQPVDLAFGSGRCALALNRDAWDQDRQEYVVGPNLDGDSDDTVVVLRATDAGGRTVAHLVNYACHPTTLAWDNRQISPDFVGGLRDAVEAHDEAPCLFLQGAAGDLGPVRGFVGDLDTADSNGRQLGYAALAALEALPPAGRQWAYQGAQVSGATLGLWDWSDLDAERAASARIVTRRHLRLPLTCRDLPSRAELEAGIEDWSGRQRDAGAAGDEPAVREARARIERLRRALRQIEGLPADGVVDYDIHLWRLGEAVLVLLGGEPYQQLQVNLRRRFPGTPILLGELCNRPHAYLLPEDRYGIGLYQDRVCLVAAGSLERIEAAVAAALHEWQLP